ncbi:MULTISPECIES: SixA phosphatase family protein [unclassified Streptomyces]|uniref:SixA phosphatase family protein n=1 Tax=unclassified Streptomyces TaxID=2593676 RepID=UPI002253C9ED|nr:MULTISPECIES: histidine phosphatase family protein [unclassified Streptomyces]WSP53731.1 histidine phosphatase family protein [Streptomyces sp. NBC_01241]WSU25600.1 histidine phosphatase family protein [Streptomyces sp. NBC_01108]WTA34337.1 histidine phosphatase family protein [Streptomyces sp. NBC_00846]MCX4785132.1 histidine phosphatase family protein [Streptomyces sp. NBC_01221]MCX4798927.1 histidine phosphatase family protein [Streptomyces sp. NBC_01242]
MTQASARLIVLRHAKSAWPEGVPDHERPLAGRGRRDAPAAGRWLYEAQCVPDLVICSTARRTRQTWDLVAAELGAAPEVVFEPRVYEASASALVSVVRDVPERRRTVLLIGHQPGVQDMVLSLAGDGDDEALTRARVKYPTAAVAVLMLPGTWARLAPGTATLTDFAVPRGVHVRRSNDA